MEHYIRPQTLSEMTRSTVPYIILKHSRDCGQSRDVLEACERLYTHLPVYVVTVQDHPALSEKITHYFGIPHETPQLLLIERDVVRYHASHRDISIPTVCAMIGI
jgi:bacillithiol system protein YtxJ